MTQDNIKAVAIYNAEKKELMGVFARCNYAVKYLFKTYNDQDQRKVYKALERKQKLEGTDFFFPVAIRYANSIQIEMLAGDEFKICGSYPIPHPKRFTAASTVL